MTIATVSLSLGSDWEEFATGGQFGIQSMGSRSVALYIGSSLPEADEDQYIILNTSGDRSFSVDLDGSTAYLRCLDAGRTIVRGWRTE